MSTRTAKCLDARRRTKLDALYDRGASRRRPAGSSCRRIRPTTEPRDRVDATNRPSHAATTTDADDTGRAAARPTTLWPAHRPLIRAPAAAKSRAASHLPRPIPEFTMHQRQGRGGQGFRYGGQHGGWSGNGNGTRHRPQRLPSGATQRTRPGPAVTLVVAAVVTGIAAAARTGSRSSASLQAFMSTPTLAHGSRPRCRRRQQTIDLVGDRAGGRRAKAPRSSLTYQNERLDENVRELARDADRAAALCRATSATTRRSTRCSQAIEREYGRLDFSCTASAFADREDLDRPFVETSREGFQHALDVSAYSLVALSRRAAPLMEKNGGGSILTLSYPRQRARVSELQRDGRGQGRARIVRALSRARSRPEEHPRERDLGRADQDAGRGRAFQASRAFCRPTAIARRSAARSRPPKWPTPRCSCSARPAAPSPAKCSWSMAATTRWASRR